MDFIMLSTFCIFLTLGVIFSHFSTLFVNFMTFVYTILQNYKKEELFLYDYDNVKFITWKSEFGFGLALN